MIESPLSGMFAYIGHDIASGGIWLAARYDAILPVLKIMSALASALLVYATVYSRNAGKYGEWSSDQWRMTMGGRDLAERRLRRLWKTACADIQSRTDRTKWTSALKGAEGVMQEGFRIRGYHGLSDGARTQAALDAGELKTVSEMEAAHGAYVACKNENMAFAHETAIEGLKNYKKVIRDLNVMGGEF